MYIYIYIHKCKDGGRKVQLRGDDSPEARPESQRAQGEDARLPVPCSSGAYGGGCFISARYPWNVSLRSKLPPPWRAARLPPALGGDQLFVNLSHGGNLKIKLARTLSLSLATSHAHTHSLALARSLHLQSTPTPSQTVTPKTRNRNQKPSRAARERGAGKCVVREWLRRTLGAARTARLITTALKATQDQ